MKGTSGFYDQMENYFGEDNILGFSPYRCWVISTSKAKSVAIDIEEIIGERCLKYINNLWWFNDK